MVGGPVQIVWIQWNERTMDLRGSAWYLPDPLTFTVSYKHVSAVMLVRDECMEMHVETSGGGHYTMRFADEGNARDAAAELARRMEAAG